MVAGFFLLRARQPENSREPENTGQARREPPPSRETGRPFVKKTSISLESGANLWKVEFGTPLRRFYSVNLR